MFISKKKLPADIFVTKLEQLGYDIKLDLDRFL